MKVSDRFQKNEMKPRQVKSWVIPEAGADFVCATEDIPEVYKRPCGEKNPVICPDESLGQMISEKCIPYNGGRGV